MTEDEFASDALQRMREQTKAQTDEIGVKMADAIMNVWTSDTTFKETVMPTLSKCPAFLYADIFDAMAERLTERFQSEILWYQIEGDSGNTLGA